MQTLHNSPNAIIFWHEEEGILEHQWQDVPDMADEAYRQENLTLMDKVKEVKPMKLLSDGSQNDYVISLETQEWLAQIVKERLGKEKTSLVKSAIIPHKGFVAEVASELNFDELIEKIRDNNRPSSSTQFFVSREKAWEWLIA